MSTNDEKIAGAITYCMAQVGKPYKWGGTGPNGYDCSGLIYKGYQSVGVTIPRATGGQQYAGNKVAGPLMPGDLVFPESSHVVLYIGNGKCVEAPHTGAFVRVIDTPTVWKARRMINGSIQLQEAGFFGDIGKALGDGTKQIGRGLKKGAEGITGGNDWIIDHTGIGGIVDPISGAITGTIDATEAIAKLSVFIVNPRNWYRIGLFVLGLGMLFISLRALAEKPAGIAKAGLETAYGGSIATSALGKVAK